MGSWQLVQKAYGMEPGSLPRGMLVVKSGVMSPFFSGVHKMDFTGMTDAGIDESMNKAAALLADCSHGSTWSIGPSSCHPSRELGPFLESRGLQLVEHMPAMWLELSPATMVVASTPKVSGAFTAREVASGDCAMLEVWVRTCLDIDEGVPMSPAQESSFDFHGRLTPELGFRRFIGFLDGQPVATSALHVVEGVAGIYSVAVRKNYRRRGIGKAMMYHAMEVAKREGADVAALQSSKIGVFLYEAMGFKTKYRIALYRLKSQQSE